MLLVEAIEAQHSAGRIVGGALAFGERAVTLRAIGLEPHVRLVRLRDGEGRTVAGSICLHDPPRFPVQRVALSPSAVASGGFSPPGAVGTGLRPALALAYRRRRWSGVKADSGPVTLASVPRRHSLSSRVFEVPSGMSVSRTFDPDQNSPSVGNRMSVPFALDGLPAESFGSRPDPMLTT